MAGAGRTRASLFALLTLGVLVLAPSALSAPRLVSHQGVVADDTGTPLPGPVDLVFRLFDMEAEGTGTLLWQETHLDVALTDGRYAVLLGSIEPLDPAVFDEEELYLELAIREGGAAAETLSPRTRIVSTPYSLKAEDATTLQGMGPLDLKSGPILFDESIEIESLSGAVTLKTGGTLLELDPAGQITITNVGGGSVVIQPDGTVNVAAEDVAVLANKNLSLKAVGSISIDAGGDLSLKSGAELSSVAHKIRADATEEIEFKAPLVTVLAGFLRLEAETGIVMKGAAGPLTLETGLAADGSDQSQIVLGETPGSLGLKSIAYKLDVKQAEMSATDSLQFKILDDQGASESEFNFYKISHAGLPAVQFKIGDDLDIDSLSYKLSTVQANTIATDSLLFKIQDDTGLDESEFMLKRKTAGFPAIQFKTLGDADLGAVGFKLQMETGDIAANQTLQLGSIGGTSFKGAFDIQASEYKVTADAILLKSTEFFSIEAGLLELNSIASTMKGESELNLQGGVLKLNSP